MLLVQSIISKHKRLCWVLQKKYMLDKVHLGMSYSVVIYEFKVSELTIIINKMYLNRNTYETRLYLDWLIKILWWYALKKKILYFPLDQRPDILQFTVCSDFIEHNYLK